MGVKGLVAFLRQKAPSAFVAAKREDVAGKRVGIDLAITLYRGAALAHKNGCLSHLETLVREVAGLRELGCWPIYVFDGTPPVEKAEEARKREDLRKAVERKLEEALDRLQAAPADLEALEVVDRLRRQTFRVTSDMRAQAKSLLLALGVSVAQAPGEAERSLAHMQRSGYIDLIFTEDIDVLVCGARSYVKNYGQLLHVATWETEAAAMDQRSCAKKAEHVFAEAALRGIDMNYEDFVLVALFSGTDFAPKIPRLGPATSWKHVKGCGGGDLDRCFDAFKTGGHEHLRERYKRALPLLHFNETEEGPRASEGGSVQSLQEFLTQIQEHAPIDVLSHCVQRCLVLARKPEEEEPPAKRLRLGNADDAVEGSSCAKPVSEPLVERQICPGEVVVVTGEAGREGVNHDDASPSPCRNDPREGGPSIDEDGGR